MHLKLANGAALMSLIVVVFLPSYQANAVSQPKIKLVVRVDLETGKTFKWSLNCRPNSGTHPSLTSVCNFLTSNAGRKVFNPQPTSTGCLQIFGGDSKAKITGIFYLKKISFEMDRRDGCKIAQWDSLIKVVKYR